MQQSRTLYVGMEGHQDAIAVAYVAPDHGAEGLYLGTIGTRQWDIEHRIRKRQSQATPLGFVYAAGPWGSWLSRSLTQKAYDCWGGAPALMPKKAGDRVTTDRRDAVQLARLARSGELTAGYVPQGEDEASRDLRRARADTLGDLQAAQCRLTACLLRPDSRYTGRATGSPAPLRWLSAVVCPTPAQHIVCQADVHAVTDHPARLQRLEPARQEPVQSWRLPPVVEALQALRGVPCTVAVTTVADRGDLTRFAQPRARMKCLGVIPSAYSSSERRQQGAMTTAGNTPARRALVAGAWASRYAAPGSRQLQRRLEKPPKAIQDSSWTAPVRLWKRYRKLSARGQHANQVVVAMARELVGCMWAMAQASPVTPSVHKTERPGPRNADGVLRAVEATQPRCGVPLDGVKSPLGPTRASREAGTRRRQVRWDSTHG